MMIVNDDSSIVNKLGASLTDDTKVVIYNHHMFIVQATDGSTYPGFNRTCLVYIICFSERVTSSQLGYVQPSSVMSRNTKGGKYHCTVDLLFDWFGLVCFANKNKNCHLSYS